MQFLKILKQTFEWIFIIVHYCLLVWLNYVRFLETVNNGFLWYCISWWYQVFHCLKNTNFWKWFVALHCFDTKTNDFLWVMGFEASYYTLVHWLKNSYCIWRQENWVDVREVLDFRVSKAIVNRKGNLSALSSKGWVEFSYPLFKYNSCHPTFFPCSVSAGKLLYIFKVPWLLGLPNHKYFQLFPSSTGGRHACQSYFTVLASRTLFSR